MPTVDLRTRVEAIPGTPLPYGLLSAATILDPTDPHELLGIEWEPMSCAEALTTDFCSDDIILEKTFERGGSAQASPVTVYYGRDCTAVGQTFGEAADYVRAGLAIGEQRALEQWFQTNVLAADAVNLTPVTGALSPAQALGALEGWLATNYGGVGVIHAPVTLASPFGAEGVVLKDGARLSSWAGNLITFGPGYEANVGPDSASGAGVSDTTFWVYITGPVVVRRSAVSVPMADDRDALDIITNDRYMLAERSFVVSYECAVAAVQVVRALGGGGGDSGDGDGDIDGGSP